MGEGTANCQLLVFPGYGIAGPRGSEIHSSIRITGVAISTRTSRLRERFLTRLLARLIDGGRDQLGSDLFRERTAPFFQTPRRLSRIAISIDGEVVPGSYSTRRDGSLRWTLDSPMASGNGSREVSLCAASREAGPASTTVYILEKEGTSVITDIDDTIKHSQVENRAELLANTFLRQFVPIEGMNLVYQEMARRGMAFHYVTASPWQLHKPLSEFLAGHEFPAGSMHYRVFRLSSQLLRRFGLIRRSSKWRAIRRILASFPERKFVLIGDSGEKDLETYARAFQEFPGSVRRVFIRLVAPEHENREMMITARSILPASVLHTFSTSEQLGNLIADFHDV